MPQCHPCLFLSFYWMLPHNYIFPRGNSCDILFKSPKIDKHMYILLTMELYVIWIWNSSFEVLFLHNFGASADENGQQEWTFILFLSNLFFFYSGIFWNLRGLSNPCRHKFHQDVWMYVECTILPWFLLHTPKIWRLKPFPISEEIFFSYFFNYFSPHLSPGTPLAWYFFSWIYIPRLST